MISHPHSYYIFNYWCNLINVYPSHHSVAWLCYVGVGYCLIYITFFLFFFPENDFHIHESNDGSKYCRLLRQRREKSNQRFVPHQTSVSITLSYGQRAREARGSSNFHTLARLVLGHQTTRTMLTHWHILRSKNQRLWRSLSQTHLTDDNYLWLHQHQHSTKLGQEPSASQPANRETEREKRTIQILKSKKWIRLKKTQMLNIPTTPPTKNLK